MDILKQLAYCLDGMDAEVTSFSSETLIAHKDSLIIRVSKYHKYIHTELPFRLYILIEEWKLPKLYTLESIFVENNPEIAINSMIELMVKIQNERTKINPGLR